MRSELLHEEIDQEAQEKCKVVRIRIKGDIFFGRSDRADEPIFKKKDLQYDKYELRKIISFQQLEMVMRSFKNNPAYKRCIFISKMLTTMVVLIFVLALATMAERLIDMDKDQQDVLVLITAIAVLSTSLILMVLMFRMICAINAANKELARYCHQLDLQHQRMTITVVQTEAVYNPFKLVKLQQQFPGKYSPFISQISYLEVKSYKVQDQGKSVKIYPIRGDSFENSNSNSLFKAENFYFNKAKLQRLLSFEQLNILLKPLKQKESFKNWRFWNNGLLWSLLLFLFMFVPVLFDCDQTFVLVYAISSGIAVYLILIFIVCKIQKLRKQVIMDLVELCKEVTSQQTRVEIIAHLNESTKLRNHQSILYCLQIKEYGS